MPIANPTYLNVGPSFGRTAAILFETWKALPRRLTYLQAGEFHIVSSLKRAGRLDLPQQLPCETGMAKDPQTTVQQPLGPPADRYVPKGVKTKSISQWLELKWFQYQITIGTYCLDWWERLLVHLFLLTVIALVLYGAHKQVLLVATLYKWWSQQYIAGSGTAKHPT
ncbi:hypothetical protein WJX77_008031 [Trebouxia sp. C0004]